MEHPQGVRAGAAIAVLAGILAGLLALIGKPSQGEPVRVERGEVDVVTAPVAPLATPVSLLTPRAVRCSSCSCQHALLSCTRCSGEVRAIVGQPLRMHSRHTVGWKWCCHSYLCLHAKQAGLLAAGSEHSYPGNSACWPST